MFELRNENQIWYKSEDMADWIHYGMVEIAQQDVENPENGIYTVEKFNFETGKFEVDLSATEYMHKGEIVKVVDGKFRYIEEIPKPAPTQLDRIEESILKSQEEIALEAIDTFTLELMEEGVL